MIYFSLLHYFYTPKPSILWLTDCCLRIKASAYNTKDFNTVELNRLLNSMAVYLNMC